MFNMDYTGVDAFPDFGFLAHLSPTRFNPHPITIHNAELLRRIRMNFSQWVRVSFSEHLQLAVF